MHATHSTYDGIASHDELERLLSLCDTAHMHSRVQENQFETSVQLASSWDNPYPG